MRRVDSAAANNHLAARPRLPDFAAALIFDACGAAAVILVHNHPSGDPTPSRDDRMVTDALLAASDVIGVPVHDHVVIGRGRYVSFAEQGYMLGDRRPLW